MVHIGNSWDKKLEDVFSSPEYEKLKAFLENEYSSYVIYPKAPDIFNALVYTPFEDVKVVILGQDPYHGPGQAHGLSFSVQEGVAATPSLVNIFKEIEAEIGVKNVSPCLASWARRGVLLLNAVLTVRQGEANSHKNKGWEFVTDAVIKVLNEHKAPIVFLLWGGNARAKKQLITAPQHLILEAPHPSPLSAYTGFFGCKHFSKTNEFLISQGMDPIDWRTDNR